jgi:polar amino acid transport system substrate-binding protein
MQCNFVYFNKTDAFLKPNPLGECRTTMNPLKPIVFLFLLTATASAGDTLTLSAIPGPNADLAGIILSEAYSRIGKRVIIRRMPLERALQESNNGRTDGEVSRVLGIEKGYPNLVMVPTSVVSDDFVVFTKMQNLSGVDWKTIRQYTVAIRIGEKMVERNVDGMRMGRFATTDRIFLLVDQNRYDLCITARLNGLLEIRKLGLTDIRVVEPPLETVQFYHYLHKKNRSLIPGIDAVLRSMQASGRVAEIKTDFINETY